MNTRTRLVGISLALTVSGVVAAALSTSTTSAGDDPDGAIAELTVEHCGISPAEPGPGGEDVSDLLADVTRNMFAPVTPIFLYP
jgi:hypothetical protein